MASPLKSCTSTALQKYSYEAGIRYEESDAEAWGAERAYRLTDNGEPEDTYFVCYDRIFLQINAGWELTTEQMGMIGEKINSLAQ